MRPRHSKMMRITVVTLAALLALAPFAQAKTRRAPYGLPAGAHVLETRQLELVGAKKRALVLWMLRPKKYPRDMTGEPYTCPEETRGSFYRGATRVSLVDTDAGRVVNTLKIIEDDGGEDEFDLPYRIHAGGYYHVPGVAEGREGQPTVMWLRDYNGDGRALEFALFDAWACMGLQTALFGYSERQDRVIQYPVRLETTDGKGRKSIEVLKWVDYLFGRKQTALGRWKFEIDYRGRGGSLDSYEVHYNDAAERFEGTASYTAGEEQQQ
jgi:hypothetical protein